jgi:hypothetical protein
MSKSKTPMYLGLAALTGAGYYLYSAGGNPKVAEKKFEGKPARQKKEGRKENFQKENSS